MKARILAIFAMMALLVSCGTSTSSVDPLLQKKYVDAATSHNMVIDIISIQPVKGNTQYPRGACFFTLKDGKIDGRLPFFGDAFNSLFSGEDVSYVFDNSPIENLKENFTKADKGRYYLYFDAPTIGNEKASFVLCITKTGKVDITVKCTSRSLMGYTGMIR